MNREAVAAGSFYPSEARALRQAIQDCYLHPLGPMRQPMLHEGAPGKLFGLVVPHAGYPCSGPIAAWAYATLAENGFNWLFLAGPNHTGLGTPFGLMTKGSWRTPLGDLPLAADKAFLFEDIGDLTEDPLCHLREHSLEVQLPFIQVLNPQTPFLPLCVGSDRLAALKRIGGTLGRKMAAEEGAIFLASSDLSHYHPQAEANRLDKLALEAVLALDADLLYKRVKEIPISMCGFAPTILLIEAAREAGASRTELLAYATSGETCSSKSQVVGYAAIGIWRP